MPSKKIKISELPLVESLKGLYTIGYKIIDGIKTSVKVSLEDIQTAYQDVVNAVKNSEVATKNANTAASNANEKAVLADTAAANANDTAEHPTYIGQDHYVYKWNKIAQAYDKTDIYTKGDAFSIKKVYASVANMEADKSNPDITEGDFVLVNTGDVEDPDNAKLYVKADGDFEFLVDMSGAIGFTGKTPQFSIGTISTLEAGSTATATISEDGVDSDGNPKYKINFAIPRGNPGAPFRIAGEYATLEALKSAVPDGSAVDGFMAVGTEAPYDYYAWVNGDWVNQGKIAGAGAYIFSPTFISGAITEKDYNGLKEAIQSNMIVVCDTGVPLSMLLGAYTPIMEPTVSDSNIGFLILSTSTNGILSLYVTISAVDRKISTENKTALWSDKVLAKDNTAQFTPTQDYHPATKKYADASSLYKVYDLDLNVIDRTGVLLLWEAEKDEYDATVYRGIMMGSLCTIPLNDVTQAGAFPLVSMFASFRKNTDGNNETDFIYAKDYSGIRVAPANVIYNNKDYTALQIAVSGEADIKNFVGYFDRTPLLTWVPYLEETGSGEVILNEEINNNIEITTAKELVGSSDVLTKTNTSAYTPTKDYHPATKSYVDGRIKIYKYEDYKTAINALSTPIELKGDTAVIPYINSIFGSESNCKDIISKLAKGEISSLKFIYEFEDPDSGFYSYRSISSESFYIFIEEGNGEWEIQFVYAGKLVIIDIVESSLANYKFIVKNLVSSDNITTLTKKSTEEYAAITNKDANTVYCVTD